MVAPHGPRFGRRMLPGGEGGRRDDAAMARGNNNADDNNNNKHADPVVPGLRLLAGVPRNGEGYPTLWDPALSTPGACPEFAGELMAMRQEMMQRRGEDWRYRGGCDLHPPTPSATVPSYR